MEQETKYKLIAGILFVVLLLGNFHLRQIKEENRELEDTVDSYQSALSEANDNIESANSMIEDAQGYAWSSYEEMGYALDDLSTVDTVSEPR